MDRFIEAIELSVKTKNWYSAIMLSLTLPDICGWLDSPTQGSKARYVAWFDRYLLGYYKNDFFGPDFTFLTGGDCYALRCSFLHEGGEDISRQRAREVLKRFMFSTTGSHRIRIHDVLVLNVSAFCDEVCKAVTAWSEDVVDNEDIQRRKSELLFVNTSSFQPAPGIQIS